MSRFRIFATARPAGFDGPLQPMSREDRWVSAEIRRRHPKYFSAGQLLGKSGA